MIRNTFMEKLLRCHVRGSASALDRRGGLELLVVIDRIMDRCLSQISKLGGAVASDQDIGRLDIAMDNRVLQSLSESVGDLNAEAKRLRNAESAALKRQIQQI